MLGYYSILSRWHISFTKKQRIIIITTLVIITVLLLVAQPYLKHPYNSLTLLLSLIIDIVALGFINKRKAEFEEFFISYDLQLAKNKNYQLEITVIGADESHLTSLKTVILYIRGDFDSDKIMKLLETTYECYSSDSFNAFKIRCETFDEATSLMFELKHEIRTTIQYKSIQLT